MEVQAQPCTECPFRKQSLPGYLGGFTALETLSAAVSEKERKHNQLLLDACISVKRDLERAQPNLFRLGAISSGDLSRAIEYLGEVIKEVTTE